MKQGEGIGDIVPEPGKLRLDPRGEPFRRRLEQDTPHPDAHENKEEEDGRYGEDKRKIGKGLFQPRDKITPEENENDIGGQEQEKLKGCQNLETVADAPEKPDETAVIDIQSLFGHNSSAPFCDIKF
jgi:homogentisate 1,2-dioxygenase